MNSRNDVVAQQVEAVVSAPKTHKGSQPFNHGRDEDSRLTHWTLNGAYTVPLCNRPFADIWNEKEDSP